MERLEMPQEPLICHVIIDGEVRARFARASLHHYIPEQFQYGSSSFMSNFPRRGSIMLHNGISSDSAFIQWMTKDSRHCPFKSKNVTIQMIWDANGTVESTWQLTEAMPLEYLASTDREDESITIFENLELAHMDLTVTHTPIKE